MTASTVNKAPLSFCLAQTAPIDTAFHQRLAGWLAAPRRRARSREVQHFDVGVRGLHALLSGINYCERLCACVSGNRVSSFFRQQDLGVWFVHSKFAVKYLGLITYIHRKADILRKRYRNESGQRTVCSKCPDSDCRRGFHSMTCADASCVQSCMRTV